MTNYSSLSAALVFKGAAHSTPGIKRRRAASSKASGIPRPSIHHKPAATMLTTSFRHVVENISLSLCLSSKAQDHFVVPAQKFMKHSQCLAPPSAPFADDRFPSGKKKKNCCLSLSRLHLSSKHRTKSELMTS